MSTHAGPGVPRRSRLVTANWRMLAKLVVICALMFGFGYALVPMYRALCNALGLNVLAVTEQVNSPAIGNTQVDTSRNVTVVFDANARGPWRFTPKTPSMQLHPGQMQTVIYEVWNPTHRTMKAQAIPSYAPRQAAEHFHKLQCFCFKEQTLRAGEKREFPVTFIVDDKLPKDVGTITLSYTFFEVGAPTPPAPAGNGI